MKFRYLVVLPLLALASPALAYDQSDLARFEKTGNCEGCNLKSVHMMGLAVEDAKLKRAVLRKAEIKEAQLPAADLEGADLRHANLEKATLKGARMRAAKISRFSTVTCSRCSYTEIYRSETSMLGNVFDLFTH